MRIIFSTFLETAELKTIKYFCTNEIKEMSASHSKNNTYANWK